MDRVVTIGVLVACCLDAAQLSADDKAAAARAYLAGKGLVPQGTAWILADELPLRRRLETLDALDKRHQAAMAAADLMLQKNEQIRAQLVVAEAATQRPTAPPNPKVPPPVVKPPPGKLHSSLPDVTGLGELSPLQGAMIELVNARSALTLAVLAARREFAQLEREYRELRVDEETANALAELGPKHRLGPSKGLEHEPQKLALLTESALTSTAPLYWENQRFRVGVILNEHTPATFSYAENSEPVLITTSLSQTLGLAITDKTPRQTYRTGSRVLATLQVQLPQLRIGKHLFTNVPAQVLPPEAEDLGSQLGISDLLGVAVQLEPRQMSLKLATPNATGP